MKWIQSFTVDDYLNNSIVLENVIIQGWGKQLIECKPFRWHFNIALKINKWELMQDTLLHALRQFLNATYRCFLSETYKVGKFVNINKPKTKKRWKSAEFGELKLTLHMWDWFFIKECFHQRRLLWKYMRMLWLELQKIHVYTETPLASSLDKEGRKYLLSLKQTYSCISKK